jgi:rSAM/selenodomain-associated transferase 1
MTIRQHRRGPRADGACLVVVTRAPGAAGSKTRLAEGIGDHACRRLQDAFIDDTLAWARALTLHRVVSVHPPEHTREVSRRAPGWVVVPQLAGEFGDRMREALNAGFAVAPGPVAMIATDSPTLPPDRIEEAWEVVGQGAADVAVAPADDGGWVLIAAAAPLPLDCFSGVRWSAEVTLADTEAALSRCGLRAARLDPWYDVDTAADLQRLAAELRSGAGSRLPRTGAALAQLA